MTRTARSIALFAVATSLLDAKDHIAPSRFVVPPSAGAIRGQHGENDLVAVNSITHRFLIDTILSSRPQYPAGGAFLRLTPRLVDLVPEPKVCRPASGHTATKYVAARRRFYCLLLIQLPVALL